MPSGSIQVARGVVRRAPTVGASMQVSSLQAWKSSRMPMTASACFESVTEPDDFGRGRDPYRHGYFTISDRYDPADEGHVEELRFRPAGVDDSNHGSVDGES